MSFAVFHSGRCTAAFLSLLLSLSLPAMTPSLHQGRLTIADAVTLTDAPAAVTLAPDATGAGAFLQLRLPEPKFYAVTTLGRIAGLQRFTVTHRYEPFWMRPAAGTTHAEIPAETQWLLAQVEGGEFVLLVPLVSDDARFALHGDAQGLQLTLETGDPHRPSTGGVALYVARGADPYALVAAGARAVAQQLDQLPLRRSKLVPDFTDLFGWCTWDAFYQDVDLDGVKRGLESFAQGGVEPRYLILDDGWQSTKVSPTGETRLTSFAPNAKFHGDLAPVIRLAKEHYQVQRFLVWHAVIGYWGGVDGTALPEYAVVDTPRSFGVGILRHEPHMNVQWWGQLVGLVPPENIGRFYDDYHRLLAAQGVDGVKVDTQAMLEGLALGQGGRVALSRAYREALEESVARHFDGRLINCMSHAQETFYGSPRSTVIRTSTDFWPRRPETHGLHLYTNAQVGVWFGEFMQPDWDMFQSGHEWGPYHAAGRAVSGAPIYVSDKPGVHDFALLRRLVCSDGTTLRADSPGRPTADCLLADPTREDVLLKIFNTNGDRGVIGVFNARYHAAAADKITLSGTVAPADVSGLAGEEFAAFTQNSRRVWRSQRTERTPLELAEGAWEIVSYSPINDGFAALGLADKFNSTGAVTAQRRGDDGSWEIELRDGGEFVAWSQRPPRAVESGGAAVQFQHDATTGALFASLPARGAQTVTIRW